MRVCANDYHSLLFLFCRSSSDVNSISKSVNQYICEAVQYYEDEKYQDAVEVLLPHKHKIIQIGGSHAQVSSYLYRFIDWLDKINIFLSLM